MKLIVGLGNPGREYAKTRHNAGFMVMDRLAKNLNVEISQKKFQGLYTQAMLGGEKVYLLKPQTYMNNSGECVRAMMGYFQIDIEDVLVIYDDLDLPVGSLRLRTQGSAGGQKGVKSIIQHIGTQNVARIRVGIGKDPQIATVDYVLGKVRSEDLPEFEKALDAAAKAAEASVKTDFQRVMEMYNKK